MKQIYTLISLLLLGLFGAGDKLYALPSTAAPNVHLLSDSFYMPQLSRAHRIWIYLPNDYDTTAKRYPVLYMQDAQNLFDDSLAFGGTEWQVDESLNSLFGSGDRGCIVVGIENSAQRANEYSPWVYSQTSTGGEGDEYMQFIVNTLKPYVDANYRTLTDRLHTGLAGSALGGLISMYGAIYYQQVFAKVAAMSPSVFYSEGALVQLVDSQGRQGPMRIWLEAGDSEPSSALTDLDDLYNALLAQGFVGGTEVTKVIVAGGQHNETTWGGVFPSAYQWLMMNEGNVSSVNELPPPMSVTLYPNPVSRQLKVSVTSSQHSPARFDLLNAAGQLMKTTQLFASDSHFNMDVSDLPRGLYFAQFLTAEDVTVMKVMVER